jgi:ParB family chromosome partitioning protein
LPRKNSQRSKLFELLASSRRLQAAEKAELRSVPVVVMDVFDEMAFEISLTENLQRENLSPLDIATALNEGIKHFKLTQRTLAKKLGKDVAWSIATSSFSAFPSQLESR